MSGVFRPNWKRASAKLETFFIQTGNVLQPSEGGGRNPVRTREEDNKEERDEEFYGFVCLGGQSFLAAGSADGVGFVLVGGAVVPRACSMETVCMG